MTGTALQFDAIVIGGGHAGLEAAWACANAGLRCALVTLDPARIGVMSCNPAIGGLAKGQMVREVDALGGLMGLITDATGIMFKMLNTSKGPAVRGPRAQCDKHAYARTAQAFIASRPQITVFAGAVESLLHEGGEVRGVVVSNAARTQARDLGAAQRERTPVFLAPAPEARGTLRLHAPAVVLTTGTFMRGLMHTGEAMTPGGRAGEQAASGISNALRELGLELGRLKTGTPPRLQRASIDWESLEPQTGDDPPVPFSDMTAWRAHRGGGCFPALEQVDCRITRTTTEAHELIRANLHRAPMFSGQIESAGPRYCPSIEDKVVRFAERESHHVFLEPESHESEWVYCNGISTSLPTDVQERIVRTMPGCERAEILQWGYAVEYDMVRPHQIHATGECKAIRGLFLAGQINGTSGYEEAAGQGILAGMNAALHAMGREPVLLGRDEAYIGVLMDDLVTRTPVEPYRMFTSRAEHRLLLRADNAAERLTPVAHRLGFIDGERWTAFEESRRQAESLHALIETCRIAGEPLSVRVKRPGYSERDLLADLGEHAAQVSDAARAKPRWLPGVLSRVLADRQYAGYIDRQRAEARRAREMEHRAIPAWVRYERINGLRNEARHALTRFRPATVGQAGRLEGITPADVTLLLVHMAQGPRE